MPAAGGLPSETLRFGYDELQRPKTMTSSLGGSYVGAASYTNSSQLHELALGTIGDDGKQAWLKYDYEQGTDRLTNSRVDVEGAVGDATDG